MECISGGFGRFPQRQQGVEGPCWLPAGKDLLQVLGKEHRQEAGKEWLLWVKERWRTSQRYVCISVRLNPTQISVIHLKEHQLQHKSRKAGE